MNEDNKLIARFMGWKGEFLDGDAFPHDHIVEAKAIAPKGRENCDVYTVSLNYRYSWDWLMPVVEKILNIKEVWINTIFKESTRKKPSVYIEVGKFGKPRKKISIINEENLLQAHYIAVVEFIEWYNENIDE